MKSPTSHHTTKHQRKRLYRRSEQRRSEQQRPQRKPHRMPHRRRNNENQTVKLNHRSRRRRHPRNLRSRRRRHPHRLYLRSRRRRRLHLRCLHLRSRRRRLHPPQVVICKMKERRRWTLNGKHIVFQLRKPHRRLIYSTSVLMIFLSFVYHCLTKCYLLNYKSSA